MPTLPNQIDLLVDVDTGRLVRKFTSTKAATPPEFVFGDSLPLTVQLLRKSSDEDPDKPYTHVPTTNINARVAVGKPGTGPQGGTFQLSYGSNQTGNIAYNATGTNVQEMLTRLLSVQTDGNVTVHKPGGSLYRVAFNAVGARNKLTGNIHALYPTSDFKVYESVTGDASTREVQMLSIERKAAASVNLSTTLGAAAITVTSTRTGNIALGTSEIQTVDLSTPEPFGGTWTATTNSGSVTNTSAPIAWNAAASAVQSALIATNSTIFTSNITVTGSFPFYTVEFASTKGDVADIVGTATSLDVPIGFKGNLDTNTGVFLETIAGDISTTGVLEVEIRNTVASTSWTPLQTPCKLKEDLITIN